MADTPQLLADYVKNASEGAFRELVARYVDLVHSVALRLMNGDLQLAEDVTQTVFADLAGMARTLSPNVMLGGWLHRHTCFVASNIMRRERRRQKRERLAVEMNSMEDHSEANLSAVGPVLDEAINQLGADDRKAILLRFFEELDFRSVGVALGSNEEAARKRVNRALEKLQVFLKHRGAAFSVASLASLLSAQAVTAAPVGMASTIAISALATAATSSAATFTFLTIMNTKLKIGIVCALAAAVALPFVMQQQALKRQRRENTALLQQVQRIAPLEAENERLARLSERPDKVVVNVDEQAAEILRLRGELAALRTAANAKPSGPSALSGVTGNSEMLKTLRDQQKMAMGAVYKDLAKRLKLPKEDTEKLSDLLADNVMTNIEKISAVLREGKSSAEMEPVFAEQESVLLEQVRSLLGDEGVAEYQTYTRNLLSSITAQQFKSMLSGDAAAQSAKAKKLDDFLQEQTRQVLAAAGLSPDYQTVPTLNFRNFASAEEEQRNLKLLDDIYAQVAAQGGSFLSPEDIAKFEEFRAKALSNNRMILALNRKVMAPQAK